MEKYIKLKNKILLVYLSLIVLKIILYLVGVKVPEGDITIVILTFMSISSLIMNIGYLKTKTPHPDTKKPQHEIVILVNIIVLLICFRSTVYEFIKCYN